MIIDLKDVSYHITTEDEPKTLLSNINLQIQKDAVTTIIGPNGAGKTTLVKLILGLLKPTKGNITRYTSKIGYVPQKLFANHFMPMPVDTFLTINRISGHNYPFDIHTLLKKSMHALSGGELQKVLMNVAIANQPDVLILDEPTQGIDVSGQVTFYDMLNQLKKQKSMAIILVSHDIHFVFDYTDDVICLNQHICCQGSPATIKKTNSLQQFFPGFAPYVHHHDHEH